jgi:HAUS augmin-like complex subunit 1
MAHLSLSPSAIFSPTVARQQLATAKDWNYVDSWLSQKYNGKTPPAFERNNDTLKTLLALAALNESADEERELLARAEAKALSDLQAKENANPNKELMMEIEDALTKEGQISLEALANVSVALKQPVPDTESLGRKIIDLHVASYNLDQATARVTILQDHLSSELAKIYNLISELQSEDYQQPADLQKETLEYQRKIKGLSSRLPELKERVAGLTAAAGTPVTIDDVRAEEEKYKSLMGVVRELERQVKGYHGLPQDTDLARLELEGLRIELRDLARKRDSMFEGLVERETPRKPRRE